MSPLSSCISSSYIYLQFKSNGFWFKFSKITWWTPIDVMHVVQEGLLDKKLSVILKGTGKR